MRTPDDGPADTTAGTGDGGTADSPTGPAVTLHVPEAADMHALGRAIAGLLRAGDLVLLDGELGAGKTTLSQGIGAGLGVRGPITSPTFVLARIHPSLVGGTALIHVDAYRLGGWDELEDLDLDSEMPQAVTLVEWGGGVAEGLGQDRLMIRIERRLGADAAAGDARAVHIHGKGDRYADVDLAALPD